MLVICYTNHALDQFLEDLRRIGIPDEHMVRLGSKLTLANQHLGLFEQSKYSKIPHTSLPIIHKLDRELAGLEDRLTESIAQYLDQGIRQSDLLQYIEFEDSEFFNALAFPSYSDEEETIVGKGGKAIGPNYLFDRWTAGQDAGIFKDQIIGEEESKIWSMSKNVRKSHVLRWKNALMEERSSEICALGREYNDHERSLSDMLKENRFQIIRNKRVVGCTTTGAAMYVRELEACSPGIIIAEEAGEVLEAHILTAIGANTKKLVLIGDHKQLRPKVNNYALTVEKGDGYDLNCSLFERLILGKMPHATLQRQHRMRPEISALVRNLTYPDLQDATKTQGRPNLRGFSDTVMFINHDRPEKNFTMAADKRDEGSNSSKENPFEVEMVLQCVRYLGQQGYRTNQIVVLTPYLGQLKLLKDILSKTHDPILNDLDSFDLVRAGLMPAETAKEIRQPIKISTIGKRCLQILDVCFVLVWLRLTMP